MIRTERNNPYDTGTHVCWYHASFHDSRYCLPLWNPSVVFTHCSMMKYFGVVSYDMLMTGYCVCVWIVVEHLYFVGFIVAYPNGVWTVMGMVRIRILFWWEAQSSNRVCFQCRFFFPRKNSSFSWNQNHSRQIIILIASNWYIREFQSNSNVLYLINCGNKSKSFLSFISFIVVSQHRVQVSCTSSYT